MSSRLRAPALGAAVFLILLAGAADASGGRWQSRVERIERKLDAGDWKDALEDSAELREKMVEKVAEADELLPWAARTLVCQAIAEANLGRDDDARWHWYAAQSYLGDLPTLDLSRYGRAAELLAALSIEDMPSEWVAPAPSEEDQGRYREVKIRRPVEPRFPKTLRRSAMEGKVDLEVVIDPSGRARRPRILDAGLVPTMAFPILDALQQWSFDAARRDGEPVAVLYQLRIDYR